MKKDNIVIKLIIGVILGGIFGVFSNEMLISVAMIVKSVLGQIIFFVVPLIVIGFVGASVAKLSKAKLLVIAIALAYFSTLGAGMLSMIAGYVIVPLFNIERAVEGVRELPEMFFELNIPQIMPVMSALAFAILIGLGASWVKSKVITDILDDLQAIVLKIIENVVIPILPVFVGATFAELAYEGAITKQLPVFLGVILIVIIGQFLWLTALYFIAGVYAKKNPIDVVKHYPQAYFTAVGTMSSAATLPVALESARKSDVLRKDIVSFGIPLFANIHLCGSVLSEVFMVMTVSQMLYGTLPSLTQMIVFVVLLGVFGIGAPGVPGGTVMASLGLITGVLGFDAGGTALMLTIFALQDSFGTACNVTGDGALTLILNKFSDKNGI